MRSLVVLSGLLLAGCDAWPTVMDNRTPAAISVQYLYEGYDHWSARFPVSAGKAMPLSRAHWIQGIRGLRLQEGGQTYFLSDQALRHLESACPSTELARRFSAAGDCYLIYLGKGRLHAMAATPEGLQWEQVGNGS